VTVIMPKQSLDNIMLRQTTLDKEVQAGRVQIKGDRDRLSDLLTSLDSFDPLFPIVTPRP